MRKISFFASKVFRLPGKIFNYKFQTLWVELEIATYDNPEWELKTRKELSTVQLLIYLLLTQAWIVKRLCE